MKKIIHTCDDFGLHRSINQAVLETYRNEMLSGASIIPSGAEVENAISIAKQCKNLDIGLHFTLIEELPVSDPNTIPSLLNQKGRFFKNYKEFLLRLVLGKIKKEHIQLELENQIIFLKDHGIQIIYFDSHQHLHMFPIVFSKLLPVLNQYQISLIRSSNTPYFSKNLKRIVPLFSSFMFDAMKLYIRKKGFITPDYFIGLFDSGSISVDKLLNWSSHFTDKTYEIGFHLGTSDQQLNKIYSHWKKPFSWEKEFNAINHPEYKACFEQNKITLTKYSDLINNL